MVSAQRCNRNKMSRPPVNAISKKIDTIAIWAITPNGLKVAEKIAARLPDAVLFASSGLDTGSIKSIGFERLAKRLADTFHAYQGHVFVTSTGIAVRMIAPHIKHKTIDPAVVVVDDLGQHAVSLLSGHIGGANKLTGWVAEAVGAIPVITTATDLNQVPSIDVIAGEKNLGIENPGVIKSISMTLLRRLKIWIHDPFQILTGAIPEHYLLAADTRMAPVPLTPVPNDHDGRPFPNDAPGVYVDDRVVHLPPQTLILRPKTLSAGIGCNRGTPLREIRAMLFEVLEKYELSPRSLSCIASIDLKNDEPGLLKLAEDLDIPINFYSKTNLKQVKTIATPSAVVEKHVGVKSVCEAAAILSTKMGKLIVPKQRSRNVTVAIARKVFISSE